MGASAREIEQQIKDTRDRMDQNLGELETRAATGWQRYGKVAALACAAVVSAGAGFLIWRKVRRPKWRDRLDRLSPDALRALAEEVGTRLKKPLPSVRITVNEKSAGQPGWLENMLRKVGPAVVGTAATGLVERVARPRDDSPPQAE